MPFTVSNHNKFLRLGPNRLTLSILALICLSGNELSAAPSVEAFSGAPFGVGRVTVDVFRGEPSVPLSDERFTVWQEENRAMYPVLKEEPAKSLLRQVLPIKLPQKVTLYFLFQGTESFDLSVFSPVEQAVRVQPIDSVTGHQRLMNEWWKQFSGRWRRLSRDKEFPPVAENFLTVSLARRLGRELPTGGGLFSADRATSASPEDLLAGEAYHLTVDREMLQDQPQVVEPLQPLPAAPDWPDLQISLPEGNQIEIEPIAAHVPEECFYVRFGKFLNYLWFRDLSVKWQGDLQNMINRRGIDRASSKRTEQQLSLKYNAMAKILGPQVVGDLALIGLDPYVIDGAAIGVVIQAKNNFLLSQDLMRQRRGALRTFDDAEETKLEIAGKEVSLIATPGGEVRSYYVQDNDFHLVTTSSTLVRRFIEAGQGKQALSDLASFQLARSRMSILRDDTVFVYVPEKFYENLCSPHYRIETARRVKSAREPLLRELAGYASITENQPLVEQADLVAAGLLPENFATRVDGSSLTVVDGKVVDSLRGAPGFFVPVGDMRVGEASAAEAEQYSQFLQDYRRSVGRMPPIALAVSRKTQREGEVTMSAELHAEPIMGTKVEELKQWLAEEPSTRRLKPMEGDVVALEVALSSGFFLPKEEPTVPYHVFGGLRDFRSLLVIKDGKLGAGQSYSELIRGYLGSWPRPGFLRMLSSNAPTAEPTQIRGGPVIGSFWNAQEEDFLLFSFKPEVINEVLPQLELMEAERPAHLWLAIDDLTGKQLADTANLLGYMRTREASVAASRLMNSLANQFRIDRSQCRELAERLIDGKFVCPLGGEYQMVAPERSMEMWVSSALPPENRFLLTEVPEDYQLPLLDWFRGIEADATIDSNSLEVHLELHMDAEAVPK